MAQELQTKQPDEMYCSSCGALIKRGVQFCPQCGTPAGGPRPTVFSALRLCRERFWGIALIEVTLLATFVAGITLLVVTPLAALLFLAMLFMVSAGPVALFYILGVPQYQAVAANWAAWGRGLSRLITSSVYGFVAILTLGVVGLLPIVGQVIGSILWIVWLLGLAIIAFENVGPLSIWARFWHLVKLGRSQRLLPSLLRIWLLGIVITIAAGAAGFSIGLLLQDALTEDAVTAAGVVILVFFAFVAAAFMLYTPIVFAWVTQVYSLLLQAEPARQEPRTEAQEQLFQRGCELGDEGRWQEAIAEFDKAITMNPNHGNAHAQRGLAYAELGEANRAIADMERAIALTGDPDTIADLEASIEERRETGRG